MELEERYKKAFLEEANELVEKMNHNLLDLEQNPQDTECINELFRFTHSLKSEAGLIGLSNISEIAHKMEDLIDLLRSGKTELDDKAFNVLFSGADYIEEGITLLSDKWEDLEVNTKLIASFDQIFKSLKESTQKQQQKPIQSQKESPIEIIDLNIQDLAVSNGAGIKKFSIKEISSIFELSEFQKVSLDSVKNKNNVRYIRLKIMESSPMKYPRAYLVYNNFSSLGDIIATKPDIEKDVNDDEYNEFNLLIDFQESPENSVIENACNVDEVEDFSFFGIEYPKGNTDAPKKQEQKPREKTNGVHEEEDLDADYQNIISKVRSKINTVRVELEKLDTLSRHIGELIINKSKFNQAITYLKTGREIQEVIAYMEESENELDRITDDMQNIIMGLRMIPISTIFNKFPRVVRDIAKKVGKDIDLQISGSDTEIDKKVIEEIQDPITHIIRNAIDHGVESPDERRELGKAPVGNISLRAYQEGSNIVVEISDDGKGLDKEKIHEKAVKMGLMSEFETFTDVMLYSFLFLPGFSTKEKVTDLSGRGVGLDVVKDKIEKLRGKIEINSEKDVGTSFRIILPLTLTILEILLVKASDNYFSIPIYTIDQTDRVSFSSIEKLEDYDIIRYRGEIYSVVYLSDLVDKGRDVKIDDELVYIVIVKFNDKKICILIDDLIGEQDIVLQPLDNIFERVKGISGVGLLGDGSISLILNVSEIVREYIEKNAKLFQLLTEQFNMAEFHDQVINNYQDKIPESQPAKLNKNSSEHPELLVNADDFEIQEIKKEDASIEIKDEKDWDQFLEKAEKYTNEKKNGDSKENITEISINDLT